MTGRPGRFVSTALALLVVSLVIAPTADARSWTYPRPPGITVVRGACPTSTVLAPADGCYFRSTRTVYLHGDWFTREHEFAHAFDELSMTDTDRAWFAEQVGMVGVDRHRERPADFDISQHLMMPAEARSPDEMFADAYAACSLGWGVPGRKAWKAGEQTYYGYTVTIRRQRPICNAIGILGLVRVRGRR